MKILLSSIFVLGLTGCAVQRDYTYTENFDGLGYHRESGVYVHVGNKHPTPLPPPPPKINHNHSYKPAIKPPPSYPNHMKPSPPPPFVDKKSSKPSNHRDDRDEKRPNGMWDGNDRKNQIPPPKHGPMR